MAKNPTTTAELQPLDPPEAPDNQAQKEKVDPPAPPISAAQQFINAGKHKKASRSGAAGITGQQLLSGDVIRRYGEQLVPNDEQVYLTDLTRLNAGLLAEMIIANCPACRDRQRALEKLEEVKFHAENAILFRGR